MFTFLLKLGAVKKAIVVARFGVPMAKTAYKIIQDGRITREEVHWVADYVVDNALGDSNEIRLW